MSTSASHVLRLVYNAAVQRFNVFVASLLTWYASRKADGLLGVAMYNGGALAAECSRPRCPVMDCLLGRKVVMFDNAPLLLNLGWWAPASGGEATAAYTIRRRGRVSTVYSRKKDIDVDKDIIGQRQAGHIVEILVRSGNKRNKCVDVSDVVEADWIDSAPPTLNDIIHIALHTERIGAWDIPSVMGVRITGFDKDVSLVERTFYVDAANNAVVSVD